MVPDVNAELTAVRGRLEQIASEEEALQAGERDAAAALLAHAERREAKIAGLRAAVAALAAVQDATPEEDQAGVTITSVLPCGHPQDAVRGTAGGPGGTRHCGMCAASPGDPLATTTQDRILAGAALGRARAAEPAECPDCGRTIARGQIPGHRGTQACALEQERRAREAERAAVLAAPVSDAPPAKPTTVILGGSTSRIVTCDLCGREMPQAGLKPHRGRGPCKERQAAQRATVAQVEPKAPPVEASEPKVVLPLSRPQRRPLRAEDVPSSIWGRQVQPGELRGVAVSVTRAIGAAPEVTTDNRLPRATEVFS